MDDLKLHLALIEAVEARNYVLNALMSVDAVYNLLPQRIFLVLIHSEIGAQPLVQKRVKVLKNDFDSIFAAFLEQLARQHDFMGKVDRLLSINHLPIHHEIFDASAVEIQADLLLGAF